jgi:DNA-binding transcriptional LysR family regulator
VPAYRPGFTIEQMRSFLAVAETEHVSRAAAELHLTQGAVTQQIRNFERALGIRLLERLRRGVRLTDAGRTLAASCRGAMRSLELVSEAARGIRSLETGSLLVAASPTCATYYLPALLGGFLTGHPTVQLEVVVAPSGEVNAQVRAGACDCGLIEGRVAEDLTRISIGTDELVLVASSSHPLAAVENITQAVLAKHRYVGRGASWSAESTARQMIGEAYDLSPALTLGHTDYVRAAAIGGLGYAALPLQAVEEELRKGNLKRLRWPSRKRTIHAVRRPSEGGPMLEEFWRFVKASRGG